MKRNSTVYNTIVTALVGIVILLLFSSCVDENINNEDITASDRPEESKTAKLIRLAEESNGNGDFEKAEKLADEALAIDPKLARAYLVKGLICFSRERYQEAIDNYKKAILIEPNEDLYYSSAALILARLNVSEAAIVFAERALFLDKDNKYANSAIGMAYTHKGEFDKALINYDKAIALNPEDDELYFYRSETLRELKRYREALEASKILQKHNPFAYTTYLELGLNNLELKNYKEAMEFLNKSISAERNNPWAYVGRGRIYTARKQYDSAVSEYRKAMDLLADNPYINVLIAEAYEKKGKYELALENYLTVIDFLENNEKIKDTDFNASYNAGLILYKADEFDDAQKYFRKAVKHNPKNLMAFYYLGKISEKKNRDRDALRYYRNVVDTGADNYLNASYFNEAVKWLRDFEDRTFKQEIIDKTYGNKLYMAAQKKYREGDMEKSVKLYADLLALEPDNEFGHVDIGMAYLKLGDVKKGAKHLQKAYKLNPKDASINYGMSLYYESSGQLQKAAEYSKKALKLDDYYYLAYIQLGHLYLSLKKPEEAVKYISKAIDLKPYHDFNYVNRGIAYTEIKKYDKTIRDFNTYAKMNPNDANIDFMLAKAYLIQGDGLMGEFYCIEYLKKAKDNPEFKEEIAWANNLLKELRKGPPFDE